MPTSGQYQPLDTYDLTATIASGQSASGTIDLGGVDACGFFIPADFTGTSLSILASPTPGGTFVPVQDGSGSDYALAATPGRYVPIPNLAIVAGLRFVRLASNATESADRSIVVAARPI